MGRIRTIKPEILTDAKAARLSDSAWRLWVSSWVIADDCGRFPADPVILAGLIFPGRDSVSTHGALTEASNMGFVRLYEVNGEMYGEITGWLKHQKINRPSGPKFPAPCGEFSEPSLSPHGALNADHDHDRDHDREQLCAAEPHPPPKNGKESNKGPSAADVRATAQNVVAFLNAEIDGGYKADAASTLKLIKALLAHGYSAKDMRVAVRNRVLAWKGDPKMEEFIRPKTLFALSNFEDYVAKGRAAMREHGEPDPQPTFDLVGEMRKCSQ